MHFHNTDGHFENPTCRIFLSATAYEIFFYNNCRAAHNLQGLLGYLLCSVQFISMTLDFLTLVFSD